MGRGPWSAGRSPRKTENNEEKRRGYALERERPLLEVDREDENTAGKKGPRWGRYEMITVTADSGAADHVAPKNVASHLKIQETEASRQGVKYVAANGQKIANVGQKTIQGITDEGMPLGMTWQIAEVKKPLASVGRMCDAGNVAVFTKDGGYVLPQKMLSRTL